MKVTLDLTRLRETGQITPDEYDRLLQLGRQDTGSLGINILVGFGVVAVCAGLIAILPNPFAVVGIGAAVFALGIGLGLQRAEQWSLLSQICLVLGALLVCGSVVALGQGSTQSVALVTALLAGAAIVARSSLLMAGAVLSLAALLGARTGYSHASYSLAIHQPLLTIVLFSALALAAYQASLRLASAYERIAITAARVSVLLINFGFWIGSLWGDRIAWLGGVSNMIVVPRWPFTIGWAIALLAVMIWGVKANRRWVVNVAAVFGAIHFYTQWFAVLGANALSVLLGGALMLALAYAFWQFNRRAAKAAAGGPDTARPAAA